MVIDIRTMVTCKGNIDWKGAQENFLEVWKFLIVILGTVTWVYKPVKIDQAIHLRYVHFNLCKILPQ